MKKRITVIICAAAFVSLAACSIRPDDTIDNISTKESAYTFSENASEHENSIECIGITEYPGEDGQKPLIQCQSEASGKITVPDGITEIDSSFLQNCSKISSITIPASVTFIAQDAFRNCVSLEEIIVSEDNQSYYSYDGVLYTSHKIDDPELHHGYEEYHDLYICPIGKKGNLSIPFGLNEFDGALLNDCKFITTISGKSYGFLTEYTDDMLFSFYMGMTSLIRCPPGKKGEVVFPDNSSVIVYVTVGPYSFANCSQITTITLPDTITSIGASAFMGCTSLKSIDLPESVTEIAQGAFDECPNIMVTYKDRSYTQSDLHELYNSFDG